MVIGGGVSHRLWEKAMNLNKMTLNIRPLSPYQAVDLGLALARAWYGDLWRLWWHSHKGLLAVLMAVMFGLTYAFYDDENVIMGLSGLLMFWWVKPLFERELVIYLGHRLFDEKFGIDDVANVAMPSVKAMLIKRFGARRMMMMPVYLLEGQTGKVANGRVQALSRRQESAIGWHAMSFFGAEMLLYLVGVSVLNMLLSIDVGMGTGVERELPKFIAVALDVVVYVGVVAMLTPFYVASGFTMYLCKRSLLEGWDIEIIFRKLSARHHALTHKGRA